MSVLRLKPYIRQVRSAPRPAASRVKGASIPSLAAQAPGDATDPGAWGWVMAISGAVQLLAACPGLGGQGS
jgi:hypothetical protein